MYRSACLHVFDSSGVGDREMVHIRRFPREPPPKAWVLFPTTPFLIDLAGNNREEVIALSYILFLKTFFLVLGLEGKKVNNNPFFGTFWN